jgi:hypothetical protein
MRRYVRLLDCARSRSHPEVPRFRQREEGSPVRSDLPCALDALAVCPPRSFLRLKNGYGQDDAQHYESSMLSPFPVCTPPRRVEAGFLQTTPLPESSRLLPLPVYNGTQLSLTHEQLKVGIANQRHPLTSSESSQHNPKRNKNRNYQWQNKEQ